MNTSNLPKHIHDRLKNEINPEDYNKINIRAKSAAEDIKCKLEQDHPGHTLHSVSWTSKPGDTEKVTGVKATQKEDASDIYITSINKNGEKKHHGVSLKVSDNTKADIPSSNLGMDSSGTQARRLYIEHQKEMDYVYPELAKLTNKHDRKKWLKDQPESVTADIKNRNKKLLHTVTQLLAKELQDKLNNDEFESVVNHIRDVLSAKSTPASRKIGSSYMKHTTYQSTTGEFKHKSIDPGLEYEHILNDHKNITVSHVGGVLYFYHKGEKFAQQSHKFNSQSDPKSTLKSVGIAV